MWHQRNSQQIGEGGREGGREDRDGSILATKKKKNERQVTYCSGEGGTKSLLSEWPHWI